MGFIYLLVYLWVYGSLPDQTKNDWDPKFGTHTSLEYICKLLFCSFAKPTLRHYPIYSVNYSLCPKIIERFLESWKFLNFDASDLRMTVHDSNFAKSQSKSKTTKHWNLRPVPPFVFAVSKLVIFQIPTKRWIILGQRE